jgi:trk system potassium uptake protein
VLKSQVVEKTSKPRNRLEPTTLILLSFLGAILVGAFVLWLPISLEPNVRLRFLDALFTATSAVCVTGLNVIDPATTFSAFGEAVLLVLIFLGGIGILTASTFVALIAGQRLGIAQKLHISQSLGGGTGSASSVVWSVLLFSVGVQVMGFLLLWLAWAGREPNAGYFAFFHSISAFNNAGFSLYPDSLMRYVADPWTSLIVGGLIIAGGIGFLLILNLWLHRRQPSQHPIQLSTRIALWSTAVLLGVGFVVYLGLEWSNPKTLGALEPWQRIHAAWFLSVTPRTAGFNTVDYELLSPASTFVTLILMFIGASPVGTGGGIKTTTFFVLLLAAISYVRYGGEPGAFKRRISFEVVLKSLALTFFGVQLVGVAFTLLAITEPGQNLVKLVFETVSAFATVGLSMNLTPNLSDAGRVIVVFLMFFGRVGVLTFALALGRKSEGRRIRYPEEDITVG